MDISTEKIAEMVKSVLLEMNNAPKSQTTAGGIPIGVSNRHIHLSQGDLETLFGQGYELTPIKDDNAIKFLLLFTEYKKIQKNQTNSEVNL